MDALGPRVRRNAARVTVGGTGLRTSFLPPATRSPAVPWRAREAFLVLGSGLSFLVLALIVTLGVVELQHADVRADTARALISTGVSSGLYLFLIWMVGILIVRPYHLQWRQLGLKIVGWQWLAAVPFLYAVLIFADVLYYRGMVALLGPASTWPRQLNTATINATQQPLLEALIFISGVVLAPIVEEVLFRGVLYQALRRTMSVSGAALLSSIVFALMHVLWGNAILFVPLVVMGLLLSLLFERCGSLVPGILVHACNNGIILLFSVAALSS